MEGAGKVLIRCLEGPWNVLGLFWKDFFFSIFVRFLGVWQFFFGEVLNGFWEGSREVPGRYLAGSWKVPERFLEVI